jgi:hypothetical protein
MITSVYRSPYDWTGDATRRRKRARTELPRNDNWRCGLVGVEII